VIARRRPSVADWALNAAARQHAAAVEELARAAAAASEAQLGAVEGRDVDLRGAISALRDAAAPVLRAAEDALGGAGKPSAAQLAALRSRMSEVSTSPSLSDQLREARLGWEPGESNDLFAATRAGEGAPRARPEPAKRVATKSPAKKAPTTKQPPAGADRARRRELEQTLKAAERAHDAAAAELSRAEARSSKASAAVADAEERLDKATSALAAASEEEARAAEAVDRAAHDVDAARAALSAAAE
jgi:hypothetical protein